MAKKGSLSPRELKQGLSIRKQPCRMSEKLEKKAILLYF